MAQISPKIWFGDVIVDSSEASLHVGSAAVLYGLSVYTVFPIVFGVRGVSIFRLAEHIERLQKSAKLIGIEVPEICRDQARFLDMVRELIKANETSETVFARATIHVDALVPGTRARGLHTILSVFLYEASAIVPSE